MLTSPSATSKVLSFYATCTSVVMQLRKSTMRPSVGTDCGVTLIQWPEEQKICKGLVVARVSAGGFLASQQ